MPSNDVKRNPAKPEGQQAVVEAARLVADGKPAVIATRKRCEADGVGLSHYVLMDRKAGK